MVDGMIKQVLHGTTKLVSLPVVAMLAAISMVAGAPAPASSPAGGATELDHLLQQFRGDAPQPEGEVRLEAWVESGADGPQVVVVRIEPQGRTKLISDPGITVTPRERAGIRWLVPVPYRHVDPGIDYFSGPASVRLPFAADDERPLELHVEYAWCLIDYQCFFGEETLSVATHMP